MKSFRMISPSGRRIEFRYWDSLNIYEVSNYKDVYKKTSDRDWVVGEYKLLLQLGWKVETR